MLPRPAIDQCGDRRTAHVGGSWVEFAIVHLSRFIPATVCETSGVRVSIQRMRIFAASGTVLTAGVLGLAAVGAWVLVLGSAQTPGMGGASIGVAAALFMTTWLVMLIAMMVPAMTPMAMTYQRITAARPR